MSKAKDFKELILNNNYQMISECVLANGDLSDDVALAAVSICRRRFKRKDIVILVVLDEEQDGESAIAFTEDRLHYWEENEDYKGEVLYSDIADVRYDDEYIVILKKSGEELVIYCGTELWRYNRYMYNFLMDIKEYADEREIGGI